MDLYNQWLHHAQQPTQHDNNTTPPSADSVDDDWRDSHPSTTTTNTSTSTTTTTTPPSSSTADHHHNNAMDLTDFHAITDTAPSNSNDSASASSSAFSPFPTDSNIFMPSYSSLSYAPSSWLNPPSSLPLSSYSSLNGATSTTQQQPTQMMIDPALLGGHSNYYHNFSSQQSPPSPPSRNSSAYPYQYYASPPPSSTVPETLTPQSLHAPSPPPSANQSINPASFYATPTSSSTPPATSTTAASPPAGPPSAEAPVITEEKKRKFRISIQPLLSSSAFTGAQAVNTLVDKILDFGIGIVDPSMRLEILTKIRDYSGKPYLRAWAENENAMKVTKRWLSAGSSAPKDDPLKSTVMPILHIIQRLPLTLDQLAEHKLGKMILKLTLDSVPAIKDMASDIEHQWRQLMSSAASHKANSSAVGKNPSSEDRIAKKRKIGDSTIGLGTGTGTSTSKGGSNKPSSTTAVAGGATAGARKLSASSVNTTKAATTTTAAAATGGVKKEPTTKTVVAVNPNTSKSDSSFFSSKPNKKLPSFKKAPPLSTLQQQQAQQQQVKKEEPINAFAVALEGLKRKESPVVGTNNSTPPPSATTESGTTSGGTGTGASASTGGNGGVSAGVGGSKLMKNGKPRKSVTWAAPDKLEMVKLIERAVYEDDPAEGEHPMHSLRELDRGEGAALHAHLFEELVDWYEPIPFELPPEVESFEYGSLSTERETQEQREQTALAAVYMSTAHIPDSPSEPSSVALQQQQDDQADVKMMICGPELDAIFFNDTEMSVHPPHHAPHHHLAPPPHQQHYHHPPSHEVGPGGLMDTLGQNGNGSSSTTPSFAGVVDQAKLADIAKMLSSVSPNLFSSAAAATAASSNNNATINTPPPTSLTSTTNPTMPQQPPSAWAGETEWGNQWSAASYHGNSGSYPYHQHDSTPGNPVNHYGQHGGYSADYHHNGGGGGGNHHHNSNTNGKSSRGGGGGGYAPPYKKVPCRFYIQGRCTKGDHCTYSHELS